MKTTKRDEGTPANKGLLRVWLEPDGFFAAAKVFVVVIVALLLWMNRQHVSIWFENVSHFEFAGFKIDREQAADAVDKLMQEVNLPPEEMFSKDKEDEVVALGERLSPALAGARLLWIDPHPENNIQLLRFLEAFGIKAQLVTDSQTAIVMLYSGLSVDLIVTSSRSNDLFILPSRGVRPSIEKPPATYKAPLTNCPVFLLSPEGKWTPHSETSFGAFEFVEWAKQTQLWRNMPVILYSANLGSTTANGCLSATNIQPDFARKVFALLAEVRGDKLVKKKESDLGRGGDGFGGG